MSVHIIKRRNFSTATIKARLEHAGYQCEATMADGARCLVKAERGRFQADHDLPDWMGGEPTFENCRILCLAHHAEKTVRDQGNIAKAKRIEASHLGIKSPSLPAFTAPRVKSLTSGSQGDRRIGGGQGGSLCRQSDPSTPT